MVFLVNASVMTVYILHMLVETTLQKLGLSEKETGVYLCLLGHGEGTGYLIAKRLRIKRPTAYFLLEELRKKGLVTRIPKGRRQVFIPKHPDKLLEDTQRLALDVEAIIPKLLSITPGTNESKVTLLEGEEGYLSALEDKVNLASTSTELLGFLAYSDNPPQYITDANVDSFRGIIQKKKSNIRVLTPDHPVTRQYTVRLADVPEYQVRFLPFEKYPSKTSIETIGDVVFIFSFESGQVVKIENKDLALTVRSIFAMMWDSSVPKA